MRNREDKPQKGPDKKLIGQNARDPNSEIKTITITTELGKEFNLIRHPKKVVKFNLGSSKLALDEKIKLLKRLKEISNTVDIEIAPSSTGNKGNVRVRGPSPEDVDIIVYNDKKAIEAVRMLSEADSETTLRDNFRKVAELFGVADMLLPAQGVNAAPTLEPLPDAPPKYAYKPRMEGGIEKYLRDNWTPYIEAGILSRPDLKRIDAPAYIALKNYLGGGRRLPSDIHVPDKSEALDRQIAATSNADIKHHRNLKDTATRRKRTLAPK